MKGVERLIELCAETWPGEPVVLYIWPSVEGGYSFRVAISRYQVDVTFSEGDLKQPHAVIRTLKSGMSYWHPMVKA